MQKKVEIRMKISIEINVKSSLDNHKSTELFNVPAPGILKSATNWDEIKARAFVTSIHI